MAVASLVLGIVGFFISFLPLVNLFAMFLAVIGLILGIVGLVRSKKGDGNRGMAIAGVVLCALSFVLSIVVTIGAIAFSVAFSENHPIISGNYPSTDVWSSFTFHNYR